MQTPLLQKKKIGLEDFEIKRIIGKGSYGDVFLAYKQNQPYAMKEIIKRKLHKEKKEYQAMVERELLRVMKHPGVIKLKYAFQDKNKLYFVMEFCHLGEFVRFMKEYVDYLTDEVRRFYVAEIVNMLEYLHLNGITHRDLKPQNLLLSKEGHLKLVDFGTSQISECKILSKQFKDQIQKQKMAQNSEEQQLAIEQQSEQEMMSPRKRRSTFVGTSYYISPELLQHNVCEPPSDLWALGCILYQLYYLETPFKDSTEYGVFEKIKAVDLEFPKNDAISPQAIDLIQKLLIKNPEQRLGSCSRQELNYKHLKQHPFFKGIDIDNIFSSVPPDISPKKFSMENESALELKAQEFASTATQVLNQKQSLQNQSQTQTSQIVMQGTLQMRQFPYYEQVYLRVYDNQKARLLRLEKHEQVQDLEFFSKKGQQKQEVAKMLKSQTGVFLVELKDRSKEIFRSKHAEKWIDAINNCTAKVQITNV